MDPTDPMERLRQELPSLTKAEARVAGFVASNPSAVVGTSLARFARDAGSSNTAVIRLCQKLGYDGYAEFKFSMARHLLAHEANGTDQTSDPAQRLMDTYASYIRRIPSSVDMGDVRRMADAVRDARRLAVWGAGRTAESAAHLSNRLMRIGIFNRMTSDPPMMADEANALGAGDVCVLLTVNGSASADYASDIDMVVRRGGQVLLVTMDRRIDLAGHASATVVLPWISRDNTTDLYEDQVVILAFTEILLYEVARPRG